MVHFGLVSTPPQKILVTGLGEVNKGNSEKIDEVDQESNKGGEQTENQTAGAYSKQATPRWLKEFPWLQYKEEQSLNFVMFLYG